MKLTVFIAALLSLVCAASLRAQTSVHGCQSPGTCYYIDEETGNDNNNGTSKATPWAHGWWMVDVTAASTAATHTVLSTDMYILKGGVHWTYTSVPTLATTWNITSGGRGSASGNTYQGMYIGYDPTWNKGIVNSVRLTSSGYNCTALTVTITAHAGDVTGSGATASGVIVSDTADTLGANLNLVQFVTVTAPGSNYTLNPDVSFSGSTCTVLPTAVADITSPIWDGTGAIFGNSTSVQPVIAININAGYAIIDGIEFGHYHWYDPYVGGGGVTFTIVRANGTLMQYCYFHDFVKDGAANGNLTSGSDGSQTAMINYQSDQGTTGGLVYHSFFNNYESESHGCNAYAGVCAQGVGVSGADSIVNSYFTALRAFLYTQGTFSSHQISGNNAWGLMHDGNAQHPDAFYLQDGGATFNNIIHDLVSGGAALYVENGNGSNPVQVGVTHYLFNNVVWLTGTSTPPIGFSSEFTNAGATSTSPAPTLYAYNNTFYSTSGNSACINSGQWSGNSAALAASQPYTFTLQNNHCISSQSGGHWYASIITGGCVIGTYPNGCGTWNGRTDPNSSTAQGIIDPVNTVMTPTAATTEGYAITNNYAPTASNNDTVTFASSGNSMNLTSTCSGNVNGIPLTALCSDINGVIRPSSGGWQAGAYQLGGGGNPNPGGPVAPVPIFARLSGFTDIINLSASKPAPVIARLLRGLL